MLCYDNVSIGCSSHPMLRPRGHDAWRGRLCYRNVTAFSPNVCLRQSFHWFKPIADAPFGADILWVSRILFDFFSQIADVE
jgi:hypothetical protein